MELSGRFMKVYKHQITGLVRKHLVKPFAKLLDKENKIESEIIDSCCFFIDILENLDDEIFNEFYLPIAKKFFTNWDENKEREDRSIL